MPSLADQQVRTRRFLPGLVAALLVADYALTLWIFYPGVMTYDAKFVHEDIAKGIWGDWQSPVMTWLWGLIDPVAPGPGSMFLLISDFVLDGLRSPFAHPLPRAQIELRCCCRSWPFCRRRWRLSGSSGGTCCLRLAGCLPRVWPLLAPDGHRRSGCRPSCSRLHWLPWESCCGRMPCSPPRFSPPMPSGPPDFRFAGRRSCSSRRRSASLPSCRWSITARSARRGSTRCSRS